jgi:hypothetical protein
MFDAMLGYDPGTYEVVFPVQIDPTVTGPRLLRLIDWSIAALGRVPEVLIDPATNQDMVDQLTECAAYIGDSAKFAALCNTLNSQGAKAWFEQKS